MTLIVLVLFPIAIIYGQQIYAICDDTYIYFVYARNFIEGNGLTFNGTRVEGFSSITWVLLLSTLGLTRIPLPILANILSLLSGIFVFITTYALARRIQVGSIWTALMPVVLLVASGDFVFYMSTGLEGILFSALVTLCVYFCYSQEPKVLLNSVYFPLLMALMILTRPEGALVAALLVLILTLQTKSLLLAIRCGVLLFLILGNHEIVYSQRAIPSITNLE